MWLYMHGCIVTWCLPVHTSLLSDFLTSLLPFLLIAVHYITLHRITLHHIRLWECWECLRIATITWALDGESGDNRAWPADSGALGAPQWAAENLDLGSLGQRLQNLHTTIHHHHLSHLLPLSLQIVRDSLKSLLEKPVATTKWCHSHFSQTLEYMARPSWITNPKAVVAHFQLFRSSGASPIPRGRCSSLTCHSVLPAFPAG